MAERKKCPFPHDSIDGSPNLRVSLLIPSPTPRPLLDLLGVNDQELQEQMAKGHPYEFNMGGGKVFKDYKEAVTAMMERNMPDILHDKQTEVVFMPEAHLPKVPRLVNLRAYEAKKRSLSDEDLAFLGMKRGTEEITNALGDIAENSFVGLICLQMHQPGHLWQVGLWHEDDLSLLVM